MPNPRAQKQVTLDRVTEDLKSFSQPLTAIADMMAGALRGSAAATAGLGGDVREIVDIVAPETAERVLGKRTLPTTEEMSGMLPPAIPKGALPVRQKSADFGQSFGEFTALPGSGTAAKALGYGAGRLAGSAVKNAGKAISDAMIYQTGPLSSGPLSVLAPKASVMNVIKPKGGNWLTGSVEKGLASLRDSVSGPYNPTDRDKALTNWIDRNLTNYIKKEMATPEDPVRKLAEQGILHIDPNISQVTEANARLHRDATGGSRTAKNELAKKWEDISDAYIDPHTVEAFNAFMPRDIKEANPWVSKLESNSLLFSPSTNLGRNLGFDHIIDVLREDLATGRIRPEQLSKVSMEQAVRRTFEYDQEMAKKMAEAQIKATEGMPVHKEYPEGFKWVELKPNKNLEGVDDGFGNVSSPGYEELEKALKYEGDTMGHCVGGYCDDVYEGRSRIFSLRDAKGEPHVTIEVEPQSRIGFREGEGPKTAEERFDLQTEWLKGVESGKIGDDVTFAQWWRGQHGIPEPERPLQISQIKGKQNRAPKEEYLPYVQDFVRGGQWSDVGDIANAGLRDMKGYEPLRKYLEGKGVKYERYIPESEFKQFEDDFLMDRLYPKDDPAYLPPTEGMKRGGKVSVSDNCDCQMMEVEDQKFGKGGAAKGIIEGITERLVRAPAKSKQEIEAIAERIAPQVTGEFVRKPKETQSVAGKTQKQFAREKELPVEFTDVKAVPKVEVVDPETLKGMVVTGVPGDPTVTGKSLVRVGDIKLDSPSPQHGGPLYGLGRGDDIFWASGIEPAGRVQTVAKEAMQAYDAPVVGQYIMMGPDSINYAQHFADANLSAIDLSKMTKKQIEEFNKLIRFGDEKSGPRPSFPGIENKEDAYLHFAFDPHLRKYFNKLMQMPTVTETFGLPSGQDIRFAITEAPLRDLETGVTGYSMGRLAPDVPKSALPLSEHPTYSHDIPGQFIGGLKYPTPYELSFPDTLKSVMENPTQRLAPFNSLKYVGPRQIYDQQMIDELKMYEEAMKRLTGKKKGGKVAKPMQKAEGGEIRAEDLSIEERPL